jgi:hypothetical protein
MNPIGTADQAAGRLIHQQMKERVVCGGNGATETRLAWSAPLAIR